MCDQPVRVPPVILRRRPAHTGLPPQPHVRVQATHGWSQLGLAELWQYRDLLWFHTLRNVMARYRQMALGPLWVVLNPIMSMVIFSIIFGNLAKFPSDGMPYPLFAYAAIVPWAFFSQACDKSSGSLVAEMRVISKVYFPRMILPIAGVLAGLVDFLMSFVVLVGLMLYYGFAPGTGVLLLPLYLLLASATALSVGLWSSSLAVRFRDVQTVVQSLVRAGMYVTPVAYSSTLVAHRMPRWTWAYKLNPMYWVTEGFRWCLLGAGSRPDSYMLIAVGAVVLLLVSGAYVFRRTERSIVDLL